MNTRRVASISLAAMLALAACSGGGDQQAQDSTTSSAPTETTDRADQHLLGRALGGSGAASLGSAEDAPTDTTPEPAESYTPSHNIEPIESEVPMFEG